MTTQLFMDLIREEQIFLHREDRLTDLKRRLTDPKGGQSPSYRERAVDRVRMLFRCERCLFLVRYFFKALSHNEGPQDFDTLLLKIRIDPIADDTIGLPNLPDKPLPAGPAARYLVHCTIPAYYHYFLEEPSVSEYLRTIEDCIQRPEAVSRGEELCRSIFFSTEFCLFLREIAFDLVLAQSDQQFTARSIRLFLDRLATRLGTSVHRCPRYIGQLLELFRGDDARQREILWNSFFRHFFDYPPDYFCTDFYVTLTHGVGERSLSARDFVDQLQPFVDFFLRLDGSTDRDCFSTAMCETYSSALARRYLDSFDAAALDAWQLDEAFPAAQDMTLKGFRVNAYAKAGLDERNTDFGVTGIFNNPWGDHLRPLLKMCDIIPVMSYPNDPWTGAVNLSQLLPHLEKTLVVPGPLETLPLRAALLDEFCSSGTRLQLSENAMRQIMETMRHEHVKELEEIAAIFEVIELVDMFERRRSHMCWTSIGKYDSWLERHWQHALLIGPIKDTGKFFPVMATEFFADHEKHTRLWADAASGGSDGDLMTSFLFATKELRFSAFRAAHPTLVLADSTLRSFIEAHSMDLLQLEQSNMKVDTAKSVIKLYTDKIRYAFEEDNGPLNKLLRLTDIFDAQFGRYCHLQKTHESETYAALATVSIFLANPPQLVSALHYFAACVTFEGSPLNSHGTLFCQTVIQHVVDVLFDQQGLHAFRELFAPAKTKEALLLGTKGTAEYRKQFIRRAVGVVKAVSGSVYNVPDTVWKLRVVNAASDRVATIPHAIIFTVETLEDGCVRDARRCFDDKRYAGRGILMILAVEKPGGGRDLRNLCSVAANHWQVLKLLAEHLK